jgi:hypothetical protein
MVLDLAIVACRRLMAGERRQLCHIGPALSKARETIFTFPEILVPDSDNYHNKYNDIINFPCLFIAQGGTNLRPYGGKSTGLLTAAHVLVTVLDNQGSASVEREMRLKARERPRA